LILCPAVIPKTRFYEYTPLTKVTRRDA
jgi:hypothetical protein